MHYNTVISYDAQQTLDVNYITITTSISMTQDSCETIKFGTYFSKLMSSMGVLHVVRNLTRIEKFF